MIKYFNSEKFRIIVSFGKGLIAIDSGKTFESKELIPGLSKYIVDEVERMDTSISEDPRAKTPGRVPEIKKTRGKSNGRKA